MKQLLLLLLFYSLFASETATLNAQHRPRPPTKPTPKQKPPQTAPTPVPPPTEIVNAIPKPVRQAPPPIEERIKAWKGQKIIIVTPKGSTTAEGFHPLGRPSDKLPIKDYAGRTGTITDVIEEPTRYSRETRFVIVLDSPAEQIVSSEEWVGFLAEMESANAIVGKSIWARGSVRLVKDYVPGMTEQQIDASSFWARNTQRLTVTRAVWGDNHSAIYLCFKTPSGQEGCEVADYYGGYFDPRFARGASRSDQHPWYVTIDREQFYFEDPRKQFPGWHQGIWDLIERQEIAIGMTMDMVKLVCSEGIYSRGAVVDITTPQNSGFIADCRGGVRAFPRYPFLIQGDKVVKFVQ